MHDRNKLALMIHGAWRLYAATHKVMDNHEASNAWSKDPYLSYVFPAVHTAFGHAWVYAARLVQQGGGSHYSNTSTHAHTCGFAGCGGGGGYSA